MSFLESRSQTQRDSFPWLSKFKSSVGETLLGGGIKNLPFAVKATQQKKMEKETIVRVKSKAQTRCKVFIALKMVLSKQNCIHRIMGNLK